jgi:hypothetical protein
MVEQASHRTQHDIFGDPVADRGEEQQPGEPGERFEKGFDIEGGRDQIGDDGLRRSLAPSGARSRRPD